MGELTKRRRQLTKEQLNEQIIALRKEGKSYRAIADETGASKSAVGNTINEAKNELTKIGQLPERIIGKDGKSRPATKPSTFHNVAKKRLLGAGGG